VTLAARVGRLKAGGAVFVVAGRRGRRQISRSRRFSRRSPATSSAMARSGPRRGATALTQQ
jgi:hypothetical protein